MGGIERAIAHRLWNLGATLNLTYLCLEALTALLHYRVHIYCYDLSLEGAPLEDALPRAQEIGILVNNGGIALRMTDQD